MNGWANEGVKCTGCGKEYKRKDTVVIATFNRDGAEQRMCIKCAERGKKSLGGWRGMVEGNNTLLKEARCAMWNSLSWDGIDMDEEMVCDNLGWDKLPSPDMWQ